ncbi:pyridoxal-phosphate dependent enzyme [Catellatospora coxensis]
MSERTMPSFREVRAAAVRAGNRRGRPVSSARGTCFVPLMVGNTPLVVVRLRVGGRAATLRLKLESFNPCGSMKDRTAVALYDSVADKLDPAVGIVESTSGNLGVALASLARANRVRFTAVVDPRVPSAALHELRRLDATLVLVDEEDGRGGYLMNRLRRVRSCSPSSRPCAGPTSTTTPPTRAPTSSAPRPSWPRRCPGTAWCWSRCPPAARWRHPPLRRRGDPLGRARRRRVRLVRRRARAGPAGAARHRLQPPLGVRRGRRRPHRVGRHRRRGGCLPVAAGVVRHRRRGQRRGAGVGGAAPDRTRGSRRRRACARTGPATT